MTFDIDTICTRIESFLAANQKISEIEDEALKKKLIDSLAEQMSIAETIVFTILVNSGSEVSDAYVAEMEGCLVLAEALYKVAIDIDINTPLSDLPSEKTERLELAADELKEWFALSRKLVNKLRGAVDEPTGKTSS